MGMREKEENKDGNLQQNGTGQGKGPRGSQ